MRQRELLGGQGKGLPNHRGPPGLPYGRHLSGSHPNVKQKDRLGSICGRRRRRERSRKPGARGQRLGEQKRAETPKKNRSRSRGDSKARTRDRRRRAQDRPMETGTSRARSGEHGEQGKRKHEEQIGKRAESEWKGHRERRGARKDRAELADGNRAVKVGPAPKTKKKARTSTSSSDTRKKKAGAR